MPVWHAATKQWVADDRLVLVGITQEQHPDRCRLFAQWQGLDFSILWDPFNLTDSKVVPNFIAIDEHGIVRSIGPDLDSFEEDFLAVDFPAPEQPVRPNMFEGACSATDNHHFVSPINSLSRGDFSRGSVEELHRMAEEHPDHARAAFRAGVAYRLRYDSPVGEPGDFQAALDHWTKALQLDPNQYIWRRRIQQYGPRMDKPYPFYSWVEKARAELIERGETPVSLQAELTGAERAEPRAGGEDRPAKPTEPDPDGKLQRDETGLIALETAVAFDTSDARRSASVHVDLRPNRELDAHWNHEAGPTVQLWIRGAEPISIEVPSRDDVPVSSEALRLDFDVTLDEGADERVIEGYALYYVCAGADGRCLYLRQDLKLTIERP